MTSKEKKEARVLLGVTYWAMSATALFVAIYASLNTDKVFATAYTYVFALVFAWLYSQSRYDFDTAKTDVKQTRLSFKRRAEVFKRRAEMLKQKAEVFKGGKKLSYSNE